MVEMHELRSSKAANSAVSSAASDSGGISGDDNKGAPLEYGETRNVGFHAYERRDPLTSLIDRCLREFSQELTFPLPIPRNTSL